MKPRTILILGWLGFVLYAYPGFLSVGAADQLVDAKYHTIPDVHSPVMTKLVEWMQIVLAGPFGMLLLQSGLILFGGYMLLRRTFSDRRAAIASACILVFPPVMGAVAVISEDVLLASFLVGAAAMFLSSRRWVRCTGLVLAMLACAMLEYAWLAAAPVVIAGFVWRTDPPALVRYATATGALIACWAIAYGLTYAVVSDDRVTRHEEEWLAYTDIAGMLANSGPLTDAEARALLEGVRLTPGDAIQQRAKTIAARFESTYKGPAPLFVPPRTDEHVEALVDARARLRDRDFGAYVKTRWQQWRRLVALDKYKKSPVYARDNVSRDHRFAAAHAHRRSVVQKFLVWVVRLVGKTPLFSPFVYFAVALILVPFARRHRTALTLLASGLLSQVGLAIASWDVEYRYSTWLVLSTVLALVLVIKQRRASASPG